MFWNGFFSFKSVIFLLEILVFWAKYTGIGIEGKWSIWYGPYHIIWIYFPWFELVAVWNDRKVNYIRSNFTSLSATRKSQLEVTLLLSRWVKISICTEQKAILANSRFLKEKELYRKENFWWANRVVYSVSQVRDLMMTEKITTETNSLLGISQMTEVPNTFNNFSTWSLWPFVRLRKIFWLSCLINFKQIFRRWIGKQH